MPMATLNTYQNAVVDRYKAADGTTDYEKVLASIALLAVSTSASAFDKCADPMALRTLEEIRACQWRVHQAQVMEEERIALVLSIAKNSGAAKGARV